MSIEIPKSTHPNPGSIFKLGIPVKASGRARLCDAKWSTSYPVYNLVNKTLSFTHLHSEFSFLKVFVFLQSHTDHHN